ncbi:hypothetical protein NSA19_02820 [Actinomyces bowdenii]|uniref:hypothetical protein n=1 Tax=Actinomyces bowdenii TaxID=131109 RepID=UPI00214AAAEC|nr:hypothetical protein [Actinomyces bowdenii]MCR2051802.1 hypothetical protein [Actinomyces bowdenii]
MSDAGPGLVFTGTMRPAPEGITCYRPLPEPQDSIAEAFDLAAQEINRAAREMGAAVRGLMEGGLRFSTEGSYIASLTKREGGE